MSDYNIQMKKNTDGIWENLYPFSKSKNIYDDERKKTTDEIFTELEKSVEKLRSVTLLLEDFPKLTTDTSDSERFQRALNSLTTGSLLLPMKEIVLDKTVYFDHSNITIQGFSKGTVIKIVNNIVGFQSLSTERTKFLNNSIINFELKNITFRGTSKTGTAIKFTGFTRGTVFENIFFEQLNKAIEMSGSWSFSIRDCFVNNCLQGFIFGDPLTGTHKESYAVNAVTIDGLSATEVRNGLDTGIALNFKNGSNAMILNSTLELCDQAINFEKYDNAKIDGCYLEQINSSLSRGQDGIVIGTKDFVSRGVKIINSYLYNFSIKIKNTQKFVYDHNTVMGTLDRIIIIDKDAPITQSTIRYDKLYGLRTKLQSSDYGTYGMWSNIYVSEENYVATDLDLISGWSTYEPDVRGGLKVLMDSSGYVHVFGAINGGSTGLTHPVTTIPLSMRPLYLSIFNCVNASGETVPVAIDSLGKLTIRKEVTDAVFISLSYKPQMA